MTREIPLTQGRVALVDDADYEWLSQWKWCYAAGYAVRSIRNPDGKPRQKHIKMHRLIAGAKDGEWVDHRNLNTLDNQRHNLRCCTITESQRNRGKQVNQVRTKYNRAPASQYKGVFKGDNAWRVRICVNGKRINIGSFTSELEAALAYDEAARLHHGEFANTNF